jgi:Raf kinase inhibitor-like YbhB/YbcL family protein
MDRRVWIFCLSGVLAFWSCTSGDGSPAGEEPALSIKLTSPAFAEGESIPRRFTCEGEDISPPLNWSDMPEGTAALALIVDDPDAPRGTWVHWVLYDMPPGLSGLEEGISTTSQVEGVGLQGVNDFRNTGYGGPCPPSGSDHRYFFKLYALDSFTGLPPGATKAELEAAMGGHILGQGQLVGHFAR